MKNIVIKGKMFGKKLVAIICLICFVFSMSSCFKPDKVVKPASYVGDDVAFYNVNTIQIPQDLDSYDLYDEVVGGMTYYGEDALVTTIIAGKFESDYTYTARSFYEKYDYDGNYMGKVGLPAGSAMQLITIYESNGNSYAVCQETYDSNNYIVYSLNFENKEMTEVNSFSLSKNDGYLLNATPVYVGGNVLLHTFFSNGHDHTSAIVAIDPNGDISWNRMFDFEIFRMSEWDEDNVLIDSVDKKFYKYTISTNTLTEIDIENSLCSKYVNGTVGTNGNLYRNRRDRIDVLNIDNKTESVLVDFNFCDIDMSKVTFCNIEKITQDKIILYDAAIRPGESFKTRKIIILNKADINPYAGRAIIEVAQLWNVNEVLGAGAYTYNNSQEEYFAYISSRYNTDGDFVVPEIYGDDLTSLEISNLIMNQLKQDIINGEGPDVIIGLGDTTSMNYSNYLMDYNELINEDNDFDTSDFFTNAFYAYQNNGELFQIPLEISGFGVLTDTTELSANDVGFIYSNYPTFVETVNEGFDPIAYDNTRDRYMQFLYANNEDAFFENGKANFDSEAFREMAEYLKNNVTENGINTSIRMPNALWWNVASFYQDIQFDELNRGWDLYGAPSLDGRGPMLSVYNTAAIVTSTSSVDASWSFVKTLLSEDVQLKSINNPINKVAFDTYAEKSLEMIDFMFQDYGRVNPMKFTEESIEHYRHMLEKIDHSDAIDSEIYAVVCEEMPPYFYGDKTLDQVIEVINKRAQLILDERD